MTVVSVPFVGLQRQHAALAAELTSAFDRVRSGSRFILGEEVECFEREFAAYCGVDHCVGVASGTAALGLSFMAAGIGPGDEVIVPAHTFIASALGVLHAGAKPVLCDVHRETGLIDIAAAEAKLSPRTAAILPVHLYGQICDMPAIMRVAERHGVAVIEDGAQAHGAHDGTDRAGSFGLAGAFSFYPSKNLGALGDGGAICTNDGVLAERARMLRDLGQQTKGNHAIVGYNERLDGLQAAFLRVKLPHLNDWNEARRRLACAYRDLLPSHLAVLPSQSPGGDVYHLFPIRSPNRNALGRGLREVGVQTGVHYTPALHEQPALAAIRDQGSDYPEAAGWAREELSLPIFESLQIQEVEYVASACFA